MKTMTGVASTLDYLRSVKGLGYCILSSHAIHLSPSNTPKLCNMYCCQPPDTREGPHFHPPLAPELMQHLTTSYACDVYSFGVLAWEVWEEEEPWAGLSQGRLEGGGQRGSETAYPGKPHHPSPREVPRITLIVCLHH